MTDEAAEWNARYAEQDRLWSGRPNVSLVRETAGLERGSALDLGCGEGADAIWLATQGWGVLGVDVSSTALARAAEQAEVAGVADRVRWQQIDLAAEFPAGEFDLISAHYVHTHGGVDLLDLERRAAGAVAPGGTLLVVVHTTMPQWDGGEDHDHAVVFPTAEELTAIVRERPGEWSVAAADEFDHEHAAPDGTVTVRTDLAVRLQRSA